MNQHKFYVYAHHRNDSGAIFYIGKGCRDRARDKSRRNRFWKNIVSKHGYTIEIIEKGLSEDAAFCLERDLIKRLGRHNLCNATDGGDGMSGYVHSKESREKMSISQKKKAPPSTETRAKISAAGKGRKKTAETRAKLSIANTGRIFSVETREKISIAGRGRNCSIETRNKRSASLSGRKRPTEVKLRISDSLNGHEISNETRSKLSIANTGKTLSPEIRAKISAALKGRKKSAQTIINMIAAQKVRRCRYERAKNGQG